MSENVRWITAAEAAKSFQSNLITRVDPSGNDSTGTVGNIGQPFLTIQAAIMAIEVLNPGVNYAVINLGNNVYTEDVTTNIERLVFRGQAKDSSGLSSITLSGKSAYLVNFIDCHLDSITSDTSLEIHLNNAGCAVGVTSGGNITIYGQGSGVITAILSCPGHSINIHDIWSIDSYIQINSAGSDVVAFNTIISELNAAASVTLTDSKVVANGSGVTPTYTNILFSNPIFPDADPHVAGAAYWITGVLHKSTG